MVFCEHNSYWSVLFYRSSSIESLYFEIVYVGGGFR